MGRFASPGASGGRPFAKAFPVAELKPAHRQRIFENPGILNELFTPFRLE
jgi:hypothetical protein